jgi:hypothetical protein
MWCALMVATRVHSSGWASAQRLQVGLPPRWVRKSTVATGVVAARAEATACLTARRVASAVCSGAQTESPEWSASPEVPAALKTRSRSWVEQ